MVFEKLVELANSKEVLEGVEMPRVHLHKWLVLGQTDYLCENGTLSDGHEKITEAQKYAQAIRELYYISLGIQEAESVAMRAQADLLEGEEELKKSKRWFGTRPQELRAQAKINQAKAQMLRCSVDAEDRGRMAKFYYKKIKELKPIVESKYPQGIEQAEADNWEAVARYKNLKDKTPGLGMGRERMDHVPLSPEHKARLGIEFGRPDMQAPLLLSDANRKQLTHPAKPRISEVKKEEPGITTQANDGAEGDLCAQQRS